MSHSTGEIWETKATNAEDGNDLGAPLPFLFLEGLRERIQSAKTSIVG